MAFRSATFAFVTIASIFLNAGVREEAYAQSTHVSPHSSIEASQLFSRAEQLLRQGSPEEARRKALAGLKLDPASAAGYDLLGLIDEDVHQYTLATKMFRKATTLAPHSSEVLNNLGNSYYLQGEKTLAESAFRAALKINPTNRNSNYSLGVVLLAEHQPRQAIPYFRAVRPADTSSLFNLVQAYLNAGDTKQGLAEAQRLSELAKTNVRVHFTLGVLLAANKQYAAGARQLEIADALQPGTFEILYNLGQAYLEADQTAKAEAALSRALQLKPESPETRYFLAQAYSRDHQDVKALELMVEAHKQSPTNTDVIFFLARLMMKQAYYEDAIPLLESGVKIAPTRPDLRAALGECYFIDGKVQKAQAEFQTLIRLQPSASSYAFMGLCYRHLGQFEKAKEYLQKGLNVDPRNAACLYNMGYIAGQQGHNKEAEQWLEKAVAADPNYVNALMELANVRINEGKFALALPLLRKCVKLDSRPGKVYYKLAMTERDLHNMQAAEMDMKVFETLSKDPSPAPYPFQHLFDYLDNRSGLPPQAQSELDLAQLQAEVKEHPGRPSDLYLLAETYFKLGQRGPAMQAISQLEQLSQGDFRTSVGIGVILARYGLLQPAIGRFRAALKVNPGSDDAWFDLADAEFRARNYPDALTAIQHISPSSQGDPSYQSLLGDIEAHLGQTAAAVQILKQAATQSPDSDAICLSLALAYVRGGEVALARQTLNEGLARIPDSGELLWGLGVVAVAQGKPQAAEQYFQKALQILPQWAGSYAALGVLYYETGQLEKARQVFKEYALNGPRGVFNAQNIQRALATAPREPAANRESAELTPQARQQIVGLALALADQRP